MFPVAGIESLTGGRTGDSRHSDPDREKRWNKMKQNVAEE